MKFDKAMQHLQPRSNILIILDSEIIQLVLEQNFPKNEHFLPDTHTYVCVYWGKKS